MTKDCGCNGSKPVGNPVVIWPGYGVNPARNNGADIEPVPIVPLRHGNWTATQLQLSNGWQNTSYGKRLNYDSYLRLLYSSATMNTKGKKQLAGKTTHPAGTIQPSQVQLGNMIQNGVPSTNYGGGGTGQIAPGVNLNRGFYG